MRAPLLLGIGALLAHAAAAQSLPAVHLPPSARLICVHPPMACAALVEHPPGAVLERRMAQHALERLPISWEVIYLVVPNDPQAIDELDRLLLIQLGQGALAASAPAVK
jgi:hypothetical protein